MDSCLFSVAIYIALCAYCLHLLRIFLFYIYNYFCFICIGDFPTCASVYPMLYCPQRTKEGIRAPGTGVPDICELLGIESMSSGRALSVLIHWLIPLPPFHFLNILQPEDVEYWRFILFKYALHFRVFWVSDPCKYLELSKDLPGVFFLDPFIIF